MATGVYPLVHNWLSADTLYPENCLFITQTELVERTLEWSKLSGREKAGLSMAMRRYAVENFDEEEVAEKIREIIEHG